ncbi:MAG: spore germination protein [Ruminococcus sp.]|nr:spore germination protein [Ruminococcus sp.]
MRPDELSRIRISHDLEHNITTIQSIAHSSADLLVDRFTAGGVRCALLCCEGMVSTSVITELILEPVTSLPDIGTPGALLRYIQDRLLLSLDRPEVTELDSLFRLMNSGFAVLLIDGLEKAPAFGVQGYPTRGIQEPSGEANIMGAHEGFAESLHLNMSLVRRRLKSPELVMEIITKGDISRTDLCLCYLQDRVPPELLAHIRRSLGKMKLEAVLSTGYVRPFLEGKGFRIFDSAGTTERPDVLSSKLIEGRVAVLIDGVPYAVVVPRLFCESFQTLDDYAFKPYYVTLIRWIKYAAFLITVLLPAVYTAVVVYHPELLNSTLLMLLVEAEKQAPLSILTETAGVLLMYEVIREAGIRLPKPVGGAVSIVSGLIIGDAAVQSGLVSTPLLTMTALAVISGFVVPELNPQVTVLRFAFLIAGSTLGLFGIGLLACAVLINICATEDFGFPYTAPISPFRLSGMQDTAVRAGFRKMQERDFTVEEYLEK